MCLCVWNFHSLSPNLFCAFCFLFEPDEWDRRIIAIYAAVPFTSLMSEVAPEGPPSRQPKVTSPVSAVGVVWWPALLLLWWPPLPRPPPPPPPPPCLGFKSRGGRDCSSLLLLLVDDDEDAVGLLLCCVGGIGRWFGLDGTAAVLASGPPPTPPLAVNFGPSEWVVGFDLMSPFGANVPFPLAKQNNYTQDIQLDDRNIN